MQDNLTWIMFLLSVQIRILLGRYFHDHVFVKYSVQPNNQL
jgi:hypothetical protein